MKTLTERLWFEVKGRRGFINITHTVEELVIRSGVKEGLCLCNVLHIPGSTSNALPPKFGGKHRRTTHDRA